jgi:predicted transposase YbfD/YdcC
MKTEGMMLITARDLLVTRLSSLEDPRIETVNKLHKLVDILMIGFCATLGGAEGWEDMEIFGLAKAEWFSQFLELPNGIPSHDTISRVFQRIAPSAFQEALIGWLLSLKSLGSQQIAVDGKTLRRSFDKASGQSPLHLLNAWASETGILLGQTAVDRKENEIVAVPKLLRLLELEGSLVSMDAMGTQTKIAHQIIEQGGDYLLALKENHPLLFEEVSQFFQQNEHPEMALIAESTMEVDAGHGRVETRKCWISHSLDWLPQRGQWKGLKTVACVQSSRDLGNGKEPSETKRFFLTSLEPEVKKIQKAIRQHWTVENTLHWTLDTTFHEDDSRIRKNHAPENLSILRKVALSWLKQKDVKRSIPSKRKKIGWDPSFLSEVVFQ